MTPRVLVEIKGLTKHYSLRAGFLTLIRTLCKLLSGYIWKFSLEKHLPWLGKAVAVRALWRE